MISKESLYIGALVYKLVRLGEICGLASIAIIFPQAAQSAAITGAEVVKEDTTYNIRFSAEAAVSRAALLSVLRDYARYIELSPAIVAAEVLRPEDAGLRLRLVLRACVLGFCRNLRKVTDVTWLSENSVEYRGLPGRGDFETSLETITIGDVDGEVGHATFEYRAEIQPRFFVPPLIGAWLISRQIREELLGTLSEIEAARSRVP